MRVTIHGARGSFPVSGPAYLRYGGHTSCFSAETPDGILVIDAGTGLSQLGAQLSAKAALPPITFLFTHLHLDHLVGLAAFKPLLHPGADITFMADQEVLGDWRAALQRLIAPPYWPVALKRLGASVRFAHLDGKSGKGAERYGIRIRWCALSHPQGCIGYRLQSQKISVVLATDYEAGGAPQDKRFADFADGADVLLHDAQYLPEELPLRRGWGHSTWEQAVAVARQVKARRLVLTSHDPGRTDEEIDRIEASAKAHFPSTVAARPGLEVGDGA